MLKESKFVNYINIILSIFMVSMFFFYEGKGSIIYIVIALLLIIASIIRGRFIIDKKVLWFFTFTLYCTISIFWADNKSNAWSVLTILIFNELIAYLIMNLVYLNNDRYKFVLELIAIGTIVLGLRVFIFHGLFVYKNARSFDGFNANYFGMYGAISTNILFYLFKQSEKKSKYRYIIEMLFTIIITLLSFSRKALIFMALPILITYIIKDNGYIKKIKKVGLVILFILLVWFVVFKVDYVYNIYGYRIEAIIDGVFKGEKSDASVNARMKFIEIGKSLFVQKPYFGYGLNNYKNNLAKIKRYGMTNCYAHNNYVELAVDLGVVGLLIYYSIYLYMFLYGLKNMKYLNYQQKLMWSILITLMICEYGIVSYYGNFYHIMLCMIWISFKNYPIKDKTL